MVLYILVALWPLFMMYQYKRFCISIQNEQANLKKKNKYLFWAAFPMFFMIAIRGEHMGADTSVYLRHFVEVQGMSLQNAIETSRMEAGYITFVKYVGTIIKNPYLYQFFYASIYFLGFQSFARQLKGTDGFYFFYFFCTFGLFMFFFTGVRQCLAISICLFSYQYLVQKKYWYVIPLIFLAYNFHKSAMLFAFPVFIWNRKLTWKNFAVYIIALYLAASYLLNVQTWMNDNFEYDYEIEAVGGGEIYLSILTIFTLISYLMVRKKQMSLDEDSYFRALFNINIITIFFWVLRLQTRVAERPSFYFLGISCALFAYTINNLTYKRDGQLMKYGLLFVAMVLYVYRLSTNFAGLVPFQMF